MNVPLTALLLVAIAAVAFCYASPSTAGYGPVNVPRECPCDLKGLWLDIVFVLDSSNGVSQNDFTAVQALLVGLIMQMNVGQSGGAQSRVSIVNVGKAATRIGDLTKYNSKEEAVEDLMSVQFQGIDDFNIGAGLVEAQRVLDESDKRPNAKNLVILFASHGVQCKKSKLGENLAQGDEDPCRIAAHMVEDPNTELMTVALRFHENGEFPTLDFGSPCYASFNDINLMESLQNLTCKANCFCEQTFSQFISTSDVCHSYGECVFPKAIASPFLSAQIGCKLDHSTLADVVNEEKHSFLKGIAVNVKQLPYWIGLFKKNGRYYWDSGLEMHPDDYTNWAKNQPDASAGDCVYAKQTDGFNVRWVSAPCSWSPPAYYYFCQKKTCDTENYCE